MSEEVKPNLKKVVVAKVMSILKLDDDGRLDRFYDKQIKIFKDFIKNIKNNSGTLEVKFDQDCDKLNDDIQDAKEALDDAYAAIKPEDVANNESMKAFGLVYWTNIEEKERVVTALEEKLEKVIKLYEEGVKERSKKIAMYEARIAKISEVA